MRLSDVASVNGIKQPQFTEVIGRNNIISFGRFAREIRSKISPDMSISDIDQLSANDPLFFYLLDREKASLELSNPGSAVVGVKGRTKNICAQIDRIADDYSLGMWFFGRGAQGLGVADETLLERILDSPIFVADNVYAYQSALATIREEWDVKEMGTIAPPFDSFFIEFDVPDDWHELRRAGFLFESVSPEVTPQKLRDLDEIGGEALTAAFLNAKWVLKITIVLQMDKKRVIGPVMECECPVAADGLLSRADRDAPDGFVFTSRATYLDNNGRETHQTAHINEVMLPLIHTAFLTLAFSHCRNVKQEEIDPNKVAKTGVPNGKKKSRGVDCERYRVLKIPKITTIRDRILEANASGTPLHGVRGFFKNFDGLPDEEGRPSLLFGQHKGRYWVPPHFRGDPQRGTSVGVYDVSPPGNAGTQVTGR
ncbi:MAG TPA: hypothetical protein PKB15_04830 [Acidimicrobiia bacterium]|nr:hypothetical protein [Acidimicrobiia bacterium]